VATVSPQGVVTGVAVGLTYVRVSLGGLTDSVDVAVVTHPAGVLGAPTNVAGSPFGIAVRRSGEVVTALLNGAAVGILPAGGGSSTTFPAGAFPTDIATSLDGLTGFVANQGDAALGRLNLVTSSQVTAVGAGLSPFRVLRSRDGSRYYVGGNGTQVGAYDAATGAFITGYTMEKDQNGLTESPDRAFLYASSLSFGVVREITVATGAVGRTFTIGASPQEVVVSADASELFVASEGSATIGVWNLTSGTKVDSVAVGAGTFGMAMSPDGARLYAGSTATGKVYVIDPATHAVLDSLATGGVPRRIAFNRTGTKAYVANESGWVDQIQ
jgi:YVTN family beta-propeller protein